MRSAPLAVGSVGFDTIAVVSAGQAAAFVKWGARFASRYVETLTADELAALQGAGLGVMPLRYARTSGWSEQTGDEDGAALARAVLALGFPSDVTAWCDLEGTFPSKGACSDYGGRFFEGAQREGLDDPGVYIGAGVPLDDHELYAVLPFRHYWRSLSQVPNVDRRGYQILQLWPANVVVVPGTPAIDVDVAQVDYLGGAARAAVA